MILQSDRRLSDDPRWKKYGCNLCTCFWFANKYRGFQVSPAIMMNAAEVFIANSWMRNDFLIKNYNRIYNWLDLSVEYADVHSPPGYQCNQDEFEHLYFERKWKGETIGHFVAGDGHGVVTYDPYGISNTVQYGKLMSKRIMRIL